jgi:sodium transport system ATP-binding protein
MIIAENLSKIYPLSKKQRKELQTDAKEQVAVDNISFECKPGRIFSLLGPNGAGKTTTLRMLSTIFNPTAGKVLIAGINTQEDPEGARKKIGFLTGSTNLYARLTPNEIIDYFGKLYQVEKHLIEERKNNLFDLLDMHDFKNKRIGKLSTGMKQKVSICRTMIHDPEVVIFDEPTSGLDVITAENIINLIRSCKERGKTVIFSSHIMSEVELLCDDMAIIHKGKLLYSDTFENFKASTKLNLTEAFISVIKNNGNATASNDTLTANTATL